VAGLGRGLDLADVLLAVVFYLITGLGVTVGFHRLLTRHGAEPGQIDISATVIRLFERLGWATGVHWPVPARLAARRR
jgi:fatty-acid desaturase